MLKYDIMNVIFVSSRARGRQEHHGYQIHRAGDTINITVHSDLVYRLLPQWAILQIQIGALSSARSDSRPESARSRPVS